MKTKSLLILIGLSTCLFLNKISAASSLNNLRDKAIEKRSLVLPKTNKVVTSAIAKLLLPSPTNLSIAKLPKEVSLPKSAIDTIVTYNESNQYLERYIYRYNEQGLTIELLKQTWNAITKSWVNYTKGSTTYAENKKMKTFWGQYWNANKWNDFNRYNFDYDAADNLTLYQEERFDAELNSWVNYELYNYEYNQQNMPTYAVAKYWNPELSEWENQYKMDAEYNPMGNVLIEQYATWEDGNWINSSKYEISYYDNQSRKTYSYTEWDRENNKWKGKYMELYTYDINNSVVNYIYKVWSETANDWVQFGQYNYVNNEKGLKVEQVYQRWENETWADKDKAEFIYDDRNNKLSEILKSWDVASSSWINNLKRLANFNDNNLITDSESAFWKTDKQSWVPSSKHLYSYNSSNITLSETMQKWDTIAVDWANEERFSYTFDENNNSTSGKYEIWDNDKWAPAIWDLPIMSYSAGPDTVLTMVAAYRFEAKFFTLNTAIKNLTFNKSVSVYPNPVKDVVRITTDEAVIKSLELCSMEGKSILKANSVLSNSTNLNMTDVKPGVYLLKITTPSGCSSRVISKK